MIALYLLPAALSALILAAHFLRDGNFAAVVGLLALIPLLALRRRWVSVVARLTLWLGTGVWLYTLTRIALERTRLGEPWLRMALILGGVALFTALSALSFHVPRLRAWYGRPAPAPAREPEDPGQAGSTSDGPSSSV